MGRLHATLSIDWGRARHSIEEMIVFGCMATSCSARGEGPVRWLWPLSSNDVSQMEQVVTVF